MPDLNHLDAILARLAREQRSLAFARSPKERELRAVWVAQAKKELAAEYAFLGISPCAPCDMTDDELLAALRE